MQLGQEIGSKLRARRLQLGMTQEQLAYLSHTSASKWDGSNVAKGITPSNPWKPCYKPCQYL